LPPVAVTFGVISDWKRPWASRKEKPIVPFSDFGLGGAPGRAWGRPTGRTSSGYVDILDDDGTEISENLFVNQLELGKRRQSRRRYRPELDAKNANNCIRAGFGRDPR
jgi:hypothetical protein